MQAMKYFILDSNNQQQGPFSIDELKSRAVGQETLVWAEGMADWTPAWQVGELRSFLFGGATGATPPPPPVGGASTGASAATPGSSLDSSATASPASPVAPARKHHPGRWVGGLFVAVMVAALVVLAVTNPSRDDHRAAIQTQINDALTPSGGNADAASGDPFAVGLGFFGDLIANQIAGPILDEILVYHNYLFFSRTTVTLRGATTTTSWGVLGRVYTVDSKALRRFLDKHSPIFNQQPEGDDAPSAPGDALSTPGDASPDAPDSPSPDSTGGTEAL